MAMKTYDLSRADRALNKPDEQVLAFATSDSTAITGATETQTNFDNSVAIPANFLRVGSRIKIQGYVKHTATTASEDNSQLLVIGATTLLTYAAIDPANDGVIWMEADVTVTAIGASGALRGKAEYRVTGAAATAGNKSLTVIDVLAIDTTARNTIAIAIDRQAAATDADSAVCRFLRVDITP